MFEKVVSSAVPRLVVPPKSVEVLPCQLCLRRRRKRSRLGKGDVFVFE